MQELSLVHRRLFVVGVALVAAITACSETQVELTFDEVCSNPDLVVDGQLWETEDTIPDTWRSKESVTGSFRLEEDGQSGVFRGPDGGVLKYRLVTEEFRSHPCRL